MANHPIRAAKRAGSRDVRQAKRNYRQVAKGTGEGNASAYSRVQEAKTKRRTNVGAARAQKAQMGGRTLGDLRGVIEGQPPAMHIGPGGFQMMPQQGNALGGMADVIAAMQRGRGGVYGGGGPMQQSGMAWQRPYQFGGGMPGMPGGAGFGGAPQGSMAPQGGMYQRPPMMAGGAPGGMQQLPAMGPMGFKGYGGQAPSGSMGGVGTNPMAPKPPTPWGGGMGQPPPVSQGPM